MAIRNVVTGGIGLNNDVIGWIVTDGFGDLSAGGGGGGDYVPLSQVAHDIAIAVRVGH